MDEDKSLSYWQSSKGILHFSIEDGREDSVKLYDFFKTGFAKRDKRWGNPNYKRVENRTFTTTVWELAETFFAHFTSVEFANRLRQYSIDPDGPMEFGIQKKLDILDKYFRYGFVATSKKANRDHHRFWQLYVEGLTSKEIEKIIPSRYFSRTTQNVVQRPEGTSPLLIGKRREEAINQLRGQTRTRATIKDFEKITMRLMGRLNGGFTDLDLLQARFYRRWNHPIVIFDNNRPPEYDSHLFPTITSLDALLDNLSNIYPRLSGHSYRINGQPKDFDAEFIHFS
jgi:hypothetical protein